MKFDVVPALMLDGDSQKGMVTAYCDHNDMRLSMRATDETFANAGDMKGLSFCAKKADAFEIRYNMGDNAPSFRFHTKCKVHDKDVKMRFKHSMQGKGATTMECSMDVNDDSMVTVCYDLAGYSGPDLKKMAVKWRYTHDDLTIEPGYNFGTESIFVDAKYRLDDENRVRAHVDMHSNDCLLEWTNSSGMGGGGDMRITARSNLDSLGNMPSLKAEKTWTVDW